MISFEARVHISPSGEPTSATLAINGHDLYTLKRSDPRSADKISALGELFYRASREGRDLVETIAEANKIVYDDNALTGELNGPVGYPRPARSVG